jgi:hypothetical protein
MGRTLDRSRRFTLPAWRRFGRLPISRNDEHIGPHQPASACNGARAMHLFLLLLENVDGRNFFAYIFACGGSLEGLPCPRAATSVHAKVSTHSTPVRNSRLHSCANPMLPETRMSRAWRRLTSAVPFVGILLHIAYRGEAANSMLQTCDHESLAQRDHRYVIISMR